MCRHGSDSGGGTSRCQLRIQLQAATQEVPFQQTQELCISYGSGSIFWIWQSSILTSGSEHHRSGSIYISCLVAHGHGVDDERNAALHRSLRNWMPTLPEEVGDVPRALRCSSSDAPEVLPQPLQYVAAGGGAL